jgi:hypothetical protein
MSLDENYDQQKEFERGLGVCKESKVKYLDWQ